MRPRLGQGSSAYLICHTLDKEATVLPFFPRSGSLAYRKIRIPRRNLALFHSDVEKRAGGWLVAESNVFKSDF